MEDIKNIEDLNSELTYDLGTNYGHLGECLLKKTILFELKIPYLIIEKSIAKTKSVSFFSCKFYDTVKLERNEENITFEDCIFYSKVDAFNTVFKGKVRFRNCEFKGETSFSNTRFNGLADFWNCTFSKPTTFYKTDFNETVVFSGATFKENLLFTYSLFGNKAIFGRTNFDKGVDISQAILSGDLQLFDLKFNFNNYDTEYIGLDNSKFQNLIIKEHKIPLINKVATFQILRNQFSKQGNHIDEVLMQREEKKAFSLLTKRRRKDKSWSESVVGDRFILWLNRWSNNYKNDFRRGIIFTLITAILFLFLTIVSTSSFWNGICLECPIDWSKAGVIVKLFVNFLNPVHKIDYLDKLGPIWGLSYIFDFIGRIAVGYGVYQTIQAFRKFR